MPEGTTGGEGERPTIKQRLVGTWRALVRRGQIDQPVPNQIITQENTENRYLTSESISAQFPLTDFRYYRDSLERLTLGNHYNPETDTSIPLILPGEDRDSSNRIAAAAYNIFLDTLRGLREGRVDGQGQPYILCEDEVSDTQVLTQATITEREEFTKRAISGLISRHFFLNAETEFAAGAVSAVAVMIGREIAQASKIVQQAIEEVEYPEIKAPFASAINTFSQARVEELLSYIKGSKKRIIHEETQYTLKHGPDKYGSFEEAYEASARTGEPLLSIEGEDFVAAPVEHPEREPYRLEEREVNMTKPLREAVHHSRAEMIRQAKLLAVRYLGLKPESQNYSPSPPRWWISGEGGEGLRSTELLIYIPFGDSSPEQANFPSFLQGFDKGWYLIRMPFDDDGNIRMTFVKSLHS